MVDRGLSGQHLPVHIKPQPDELLSSWLMRLSLAHGRELRALCAYLWPRIRVWGKDFDWRSDDDVLVLLAQKTAAPLAQVAATSFKDYEGRLFESYVPSRYPPWLLLNSMHDYQRRLPALQFCPQCLDTDAQPYFRRHWRLAFFTICTTHRQRLHDRCPCCLAPINFHCLPLDSPLLAVCYRCRFDLRLARALILENDPLHQRLLRFQEMLWHVLATTEYYLPGHGKVPSYDYFRVLRQLARVLITYRQAEYYRAKLCRQLGIADFQPYFLLPKRRVVEVLSVNDRFQLMQLLASWLDQWPDQFIAVCMAAMVWGSALLERMPSPPAWYEQTAQQITWSNVLNRIFQQWEHELPDWNPSKITLQGNTPMST